MSKVKTIDITALEWFDKVNGNSYFAATVSVNFGMPDQRNYVLPYQYGYGDHYKSEAAQLLREKGEIDMIEHKYTKDGKERSNGFESLWQWADRNKIIVRYTKHENCKKRELLELN